MANIWFVLVLNFVLDDHSEESVIIRFDAKDLVDGLIFITFYRAVWSQQEFAELGKVLDIFGLESFSLLALSPWTCANYARDFVFKIDLLQSQFIFLFLHLSVIIQNDGLLHISLCIAKLDLQLLDSLIMFGILIRCDDIQPFIVCLDLLFSGSRYSLMELCTLLWVIKDVQQFGAVVNCLCMLAISSHLLFSWVFDESIFQFIYFGIVCKIFFVFSWDVSKCLFNFQ